MRIKVIADSNIITPVAASPSRQPMRLAIVPAINAPMTNPSIAAMRSSVYPASRLPPLRSYTSPTIAASVGALRP